MGLLTGQTIVSTYEQLLKITSEDIGTNASAKYIEDGKGQASALSISQHRVGIGTATPQAVGSVTGASAVSTDVGIFQITTGTGALANSKLTFGVVDTDYAYIQSVLPESQAYDLALQPGGGFVGIGTTAPDGLLEVSKDAAIASMIISAYDDGAAVYPKLILRKADGTEADPDLVHDNDILGMIEFSGSDNDSDDVFISGAEIIARVNGIPTDNEMPCDLEFWTNTGTTGTGSVAKMIILEGGNVGIGTAAPSSLLHVSKTSADTVLRVGNNGNYDQYVYFNGGSDWSVGMDYSNTNAFSIANASSLGSGHKLVITTAGNVGIGVTSPDTEMSAGTFLEIKKASGIAGLGLNGGGSSRWELTSDTGDDFKISRNGSTAMTIDGSNNNVGIGVTTPEHALHVITPGQTDDGILKVGGSGANLGLEIEYDQASATAAKITCNPTYTNTGALMHICVDGDANANQLVLKGDGNVGIGTSEPSTKFHVVDTSSLKYENNSLILTRAGGHLLTLLNASSTIADNNALGYIRFEGNENAAGQVASASIEGYADAAWGGNSDCPSRIIFTTTPASSATSVERMRIDKDGNVGIGTDDPACALDVDGAIAGKILAVTSSSDATDISGYMAIRVNTNGGTVVLGGLVGGVAGQILYIYKETTSNSLTLENSEGVNQSINLLSGADESVVGVGGWSLLCDGSGWFAMSQPTGAADAG